MPSTPTSSISNQIRIAGGNSSVNSSIDFKTVASH